MNNLRNHNNTLNEPITAIVIGLIKLGVFLAAVDWSKFGGWDEMAGGVQTVGQSMFVYPLIKAIQELSAKNDALEARLTTLEG